MLSIYRRHSPNCPQTSRRYRRCNCPCWAEGTVEGKYYRRALKVRSWERAQEKLREMEQGATGERVTVAKACDAFIEDAKARGLRPPSIYKYDLLFRRLKTFAEQEGFRFIDELDLEALRRFRASWNHKNFAARNKTENLRSLFRFAYDAKWVRENPARQLKSPKVMAVPTMPFSPDEIQAVVKACDSYGGPNKQLLKAFVLLLRQ